MQEINDDEVAVIMVTFNPKLSILKKTLPQLQRCFSLVVSDNGSHNVNQIKQLLRSAPNAKLLAHSRNLGIAKAQNDALRYIFKNLKQIKYFCFLDQDSFLAESKILKLCQDLHNLMTSKKAAILGPAIKVPFLGKQNVFQHQYQLVPEIISSGSVIAKQMFTKLGLFSEELFIDFVDYEWCWRARKYGYHVFVDQNVFLKHQLGWKKNEIRRGQNIIAAFRLYYVFRNCLYLMKTKRMITTEKKLWRKNLLDQAWYNLMFCPHRWQRFKMIIKGCWAAVRMVHESTKDLVTNGQKDWRQSI
ncbi:glycosyltransferase [Liquorilactobacillus sicerae]|uniref:glycosyltransferase n=1 Tax=Liquorilactobacillus sicerae TaxID=1416943 RepID=UPI0024808EA1|nr:glycosyltransferase [Liquorilactobacillus sicerae]